MITAWKPETLHKIMDLQWTTTPPTEEGWYWVDTSQWANRGVPEVVEVRLIEDKGLRAFETGDDVGIAVSAYELWLGPLPVPEPPTE
jgi:hypothetical protein